MLGLTKNHICFVNLLSVKYSPKKTQLAKILKIVIKNSNSFEIVQLINIFSLILY